MSPKTVLVPILSLVVAAAVVAVGLVCYLEAVTAILGTLE